MRRIPRPWSTTPILKCSGCEAKLYGNRYGGTQMPKWWWCACYVGVVAASLVVVPRGNTLLAWTTMVVFGVIWWRCADNFYEAFWYWRHPTRCKRDRGHPAPAES